MKSYDLSKIIIGDLHGDVEKTLSVLKNINESEDTDMGQKTYSGGAKRHSFRLGTLPTMSSDMVRVSRMLNSSAHSSVNAAPQPAVNTEKLNKYVERTIYWMEYLNEAEDILYRQDFEKIASNYTKSQSEIESDNVKAFKALGIEYNPIGSSYSYRGNNPAKALHDLINTRPLFVECKEAMNLASYLALKDLLGNSEFNKRIEHLHDGVMHFESIPFYTLKRFTRSLEDCEQHGPLILNPSELSLGDNVYIVGNALGFGVHPTSQLNGYNLIHVGEGRFIGFSSVKEPHRSQEAFLKILEDACRLSPSRKDTSEIARLSLSHPNNFPTCSPLSRSEIADFIISGKNNTFPTLGAIGQWVIDPILFTYYIGHYYYFKSERDKRKSVVFIDKFEKSLTNNNAAGLNLDVFEQSEPHQKLIAQELNEFYHKAISRIAQKRMGGLVIQGRAGTGKTSGCKILLSALEAKGYTVWHAFFERFDMPSELVIRVLQLSMDMQDQKAIDLVIDHYRNQWIQADILFIDDLYKDHGAYGLMAKAAYPFCMLKKKQLVMTTNGNFYEIIPGLTHQLSWVRVVDIEGQDYRQKNHWKPADETQLITSPLIAMPQTSGQNKLQHCLEQFGAAPKGYHGLWITGKPGIGKTTLIEAYLKKTQKAYLKLTPKNNPKEALEILKTYEGDIIWLEDVNAVGWLEQNDVLFEYILNIADNGDRKSPVKLIITSNSLDLNELVKKVIFPVKQELKERYLSRAAALFHFLKLDESVDFRSQANAESKKCYIRHESDASQLESPLEFSMLSYRNNICRLSTSNQWQRRADVEKTQKEKFLQTKAVCILWDSEAYNFFLGDEFSVLLDGIETGEKALEIVLPDNMKYDDWFSGIKKEQKDMVCPGHTVHLLSRINRFQRVDSKTIEQTNSKMQIT